MTDELRRQFHQALEELKSSLVHLGRMTLETIPRATAALLECDLKLAQSVIDGDDAIDLESLEIEKHAMRLLALQQPMARDLRALMTVIKLNADLERSADLCANISKTIRRIYGVRFPPTVRIAIEQMSAEAFRLTSLAVDAYRDLDVSVASALDDMDDRLDSLQVELMRAVFDAHAAQTVDLQQAVQLALIGRYYERIGDHAVNMGERVQYLVTGWLPEHAATARAAIRAHTDESEPSERPGT